MLSALKELLSELLKELFKELFKAGPKKPSAALSPGSPSDPSAGTSKPRWLSICAVLGTAAAATAGTWPCRRWVVWITAVSALA